MFVNFIHDNNIEFWSFFWIIKPKCKNKRKFEKKIFIEIFVYFEIVKKK